MGSLYVNGLLYFIVRLESFVFMGKVLCFCFILFIEFWFLEFLILKSYGIKN